jgi:hypothetical protein
MATLVLEGISQEEQARRRAFVQRALRLNQSEGLEPTERLRALTERYISGEISFEECSSVLRGWREAAAA